VIVEECVQGLEHSVETVTWAGETYVLAVSDKTKTPAPARVDKSVNYPTVLTGSALQAVHETAQAAVRALGITVGAAHVELCSTPAGPRLFELGARCGGGGTPDPIVPYVTGIEMLNEVVRVHAGDAPGALTPRVSRGACYRFLTPSPGVFRAVHGVSDVAGWPGVLDCGVTLKPGDVIRAVREGIDRVGFVITAAECREEAVVIADRAEEYITFDVA
jgi:biotin carboxylase